MKKRFLLSIFTCLLTMILLVGCNFNSIDSDSDAESTPDDVPVIYVVTFQTEDGEITREVAEGQALTDIPELPTEAGYTYSWSVSDFSNITSNLTVTLNKDANVYTVTYDLEGLEDVEKMENVLNITKMFKIGDEIFDTNALERVCPNSRRTCAVFKIDLYDE